MRRTGQRRGALSHRATLNAFQWLRYGPWLARVVVTRRCNLKCGYCTEYDRTSDPAPYEELTLRLAKLAELRAWAVCLTGGEPTMHPRLPDLVAEMRRLGFKRRMLITNGWRLTPALNGADLTDMQISVDGVNPTKVTAKTLKPLRKKLELLAEKAAFQGVMSGVIGSAPAEETLEVVDFAKAHGFTPRILLVPARAPAGGADVRRSYANCRRRTLRAPAGASDRGDWVSPGQWEHRLPSIRVRRSFIWSASTKNDPLASVPRFLQSR